MRSLRSKKNPSFSMAVVRSQYWVRSDSSGDGWTLSGLGMVPSTLQGLFCKDQLDTSLALSCC